MEQTQQEIPQRFMVEIIRFFEKLKEQGLTKADLTVETTKEVIGDKLVFTDILKAGSTVVAEATRIDPRSLEDIKKAAIDDKAEVEANATLSKAAIDDVIAIIDPALSKKEAESIDVDKGVEPVVPE